MKTRLNVNVDHVATLRQARMGDEPDPVTAAAQAELAGASGIVVHLREDRRHIQERDLLLLRQTVRTKLNMEMAVTDEMIEIACETLPDVVTLVPEKRQEITTEGGLDVRGDTERIAAGIEKLKSSGLFVSIFIDPDPEQISASAQTGAHMVELHTGSYANARDETGMMMELDKIRKSTEDALSHRLRVSAGHGLNYVNVTAVSQIDGIEELNIGHSIISRAVLSGMEEAVRDMINLL
ncbi:MAG: pyridoxine 5'-phosphate synthase [Candidatus Dadabacteria bacterium]|nr:pyridoxine 5'-phosphate synthase [Candidatus Dadabacteria bacterium]MDE0291354.1 pyridoxine 5'-phosphate synthase [Candidatus Dadabacteria bacterium]MDE0477410.1 pyridoxine 5'-phosphate synthase [Candidatus Dadabacteria bacterium]